MNEKLKEIEEKCYEKVPMYTNGFEEVFGDVFNKEKFAQLLIQECAFLIQRQKHRVQANVEYKRGHTEASDDAVSIIKKYFGIE